MTMTRRKFLIAGGLLTGSLAIGYGFYSGDPDNAAYAKTTQSGEVALNAWVKIAPDGVITIAVHRAEMGQGIYTALAMLVAEELDANWKDIRIEAAPVNDVYANSAILFGSLPYDDDYHKGQKSNGQWFMQKVGAMLGLMVTGGSSSSIDAWQPLREAGAIARYLLINAAARKWGVNVNSIDIVAGQIRHKTSGKQLGFGDVAADAAYISPPKDIQLKKQTAFKIIGQPIKRLDIAAKVNGSAGFGIDVQLENMLYATVKAAPVFGGDVLSFDDSKAKKMPGVKSILQIPNAVVAVANSYWRAKKALDVIDINFSDGGNNTISSDSIYADFQSALSNNNDARIYHENGDALEILAQSKEVIEATYKAPFLAHACMEPINCTALVKDESVEIWVPTQSPTLVQMIAARVSDLAKDKVTVHTTYLGGGFGRRIEMDMVVQVVSIAMQLKGTPVKLIWSREEDMQHDMYRPLALSHFKVALSDNGVPHAWFNRNASQSPSRSVTERLLPWAAADMPDNTTSDGVANMPYEFVNQLVDHVAMLNPIPVGFWRSVGHSQNAFFSESFIDELAFKANQDPYQYRRNLLSNKMSDKTKHHRDVLDKVAKLANWQAPLKQGQYRGIALAESFGSIVAQVAEITLKSENTFSVDKVYCVVDCGTVINPDTVVAQIESGIVFGLTAAMFGEINIKEGRVVESNFPDYQMLTMKDMPTIEVQLAPSGRRIGGIGEVGTPPIAPAIANAFFAATNKRIRQLPFAKHKVYLG